jgi:hypothetical protein
MQKIEKRDVALTMKFIKVASLIQCFFNIEFLMWDILLLDICCFDSDIEKYILQY